MKKLTIELSDDEVEDIVELLRRMIGAVDRFEALVNELKEDEELLEEIKGAGGGVK